MNSGNEEYLNSIKNYKTDEYLSYNDIVKLYQNKTDEQNNKIIIHFSSPLDQKLEKLNNKFVENLINNSEGNSINSQFRGVLGK